MATKDKNAEAGIDPVANLEAQDRIENGSGTLWGIATRLDGKNMENEWTLRPRLYPSPDLAAQDGNRLDANVKWTVVMVVTARGHNIYLKGQEPKVATHEG